MNGVVISNNNQKIITISSDSNAIIWDLNTGNKLVTFSGHATSIVCIAISHNDLKVITSSNHNEVIIWDAKDGK